MSAPAKRRRRTARGKNPFRVAALGAVRPEIQRTSASPRRLRWNPDRDDVQRSVVKLVLALVEFLRQLMERQAIRRMEQHTLTASEIEAVGQALMQLEKTVKDLARRFKLKPEDLNLDLGPIGRLR